MWPFTIKMFLNIVGENVNEVNTIPGALGLYLFEYADIERKSVVDKLIHEALRMFNQEKNNEPNFNSQEGC